MDIIMAGNAEIIAGFELVIYSTMRFNKNINWHIYTMDCSILNSEPHVGGSIFYHKLSKNQMDYLTFMVKFMDKDSSIEFVDFTEAYNKYLANSVNANSGFSPLAPARILADILLPETVHKCIHLDCDTVVEGSLESMFNDYANKKCIAGVYINNYKWNTYLTYDIISGILVMNLDKIRSTGFLDRARYYYNNNQYVYPDQSALLYSGEPEKLPQKYGRIDDVEHSIDETVITHISCENKNKIYHVGEHTFYNYYPRFNYLKDGIYKIRDIYGYPDIYM